MFLRPPPRKLPFELPNASRISTGGWPWTDWTHCKTQLVWLGNRSGSSQWHNSNWPRQLSWRRRQCICKCLPLPDGPIVFLAHDAFVRTNRAMTWYSSVSVRLSGTGVHCDNTVHFSADLSLWLDSPMFWAPWHQSMSTYSQPSFSSSTWKRGGVRINCKLGVISQERLKIEVKLLLSSNRKSYMPRRLAQRQMIFSDFELRFHASRWACYQMCQLRVVQQSLTQDALRSLVQSIMHCRLDYCNALLAGVADTQMKRLQSVYRILRLV